MRKWSIFRVYTRIYVLSLHGDRPEAAEVKRVLDDKPPFRRIGAQFTGVDTPCGLSLLEHAKGLTSG